LQRATSRDIEVNKSRSRRWLVPPRQVPMAISRLRGDFVFGSDDGPGPRRSIHVPLASPDFIALVDALPLFVP